MRSAHIPLNVIAAMIGRGPPTIAILIGLTTLVSWKKAERFR